MGRSGKTKRPITSGSRIECHWIFSQKAGATLEQISSSNGLVSS